MPVLHDVADEPESQVRSDANEQHMGLQTVSLKALDSGSHTELQKLVQACTDDGFFVLIDHGVPQKLLDMVFNASQSFFMQPQSVKDSVHYKQTFQPQVPGVVGYVNSQDENVGPSAADLPEHKEAFDFGTDRPAKGQPFHGPNIWPSMPGFREALEQYSTEITQVYWHLLEAFSTANGLHRSAYKDMFRDPLSQTRISHYPPTAAGQDEGTKGINAHTDSSFFTLVLQNNAGGLQAKYPGREWTYVPPISGALVVNIGDSLSALTGGVWRSTPHRVLSGEMTRFSIAHFLYPDADALAFTRLDKITPAVKVLLFKAGLSDSDAGLETLRGMTFAEYRLRVYKQYLPDRIAHVDFTDINQKQ